MKATIRAISMPPKNATRFPVMSPPGPNANPRKDPPKTTAITKNAAAAAPIMPKTMPYNALSKMPLSF